MRVLNIRAWTGINQISVCIVSVQKSEKVKKVHTSELYYTVVHLESRK